MFDLQIGPERRRSRPVNPLAWTEPEARKGEPPHLIDTTMLFAPRSGGVKRYLMAKRAWLAANRPGVRHTLVVPGEQTGEAEQGLVTIAAARLPFADGYRCPASARKWADKLLRLEPDVIEAGDPYMPGHAALEAGDRLGVPVVGFCHSDPAALAALHLGEWAEPPLRRQWAQLFRQFDQVVAPSRHIADRLAYAGVPRVRVQPLGVDTETFHPSRADPAGLRRKLSLDTKTRILVFAGRAAREKNIEVLLQTAERLGDPYHLVLLGAGALSRPQANATFLPFEHDPAQVARLLASCDAFVHANDQEPFGLIALEAMACGLPMVGVASGGIAELVDFRVGQLAARATSACMAEAVEALFARDLGVIAAAARQRAEIRHGWVSTFEGLTAIYAELTGAPAREVQPVIQLRPRASDFSALPA